MNIDYIKTLNINSEIISKLNLLNYSINGTKRLCFHDNDSSNLHVMAISIKAMSNYPPHYHKDGMEIIYLINGEIDLLIWEKGIEFGPTKINLNNNNSNSSFILIPQCIIHSTLPLLDSIYLEIKSGPYKKDNLVIVDEQLLKK